MNIGFTLPLIFPMKDLPVLHYIEMLEAKTKQNTLIQCRPKSDEICVGCLNLMEEKVKKARDFWKMKPKKQEVGGLETYKSSPWKTFCKGDLMITSNETRYKNVQPYWKCFTKID